MSAWQAAATSGGNESSCRPPSSSATERLIACPSSETLPPFTAPIRIGLASGTREGGRLVPLIGALFLWLSRKLVLPGPAGRSRQLGLELRSLSEQAVARALSGVVVPSGVAQPASRTI